MVELSLIKAYFCGDFGISVCPGGFWGGGGLVTPHRAISDLQMFVTLSF